MEHKLPRDWFHVPAPESLVLGLFELSFDIVIDGSPDEFEGGLSVTEIVGGVSYRKYSLATSDSELLASPPPPSDFQVPHMVHLREGFVA
ncbi:hypothetical protein RJT34_04470 [Clitoria ternatea]|uniref:Uncharacterized protein n=1 Tax=Clitoria ternatea TaxID=43366 RepID=A0AAN9Q0L7_CLITE